MYGAECIKGCREKKESADAYCKRIGSGAIMTAKETYELFAKVEDKEQELRGVVDNVKNAFEKLGESSDNINHLKEKNDEGMVAISELSLKFGENIKSTQAVSEEIKANV